jgi:hypothetical protein
MKMPLFLLGLVLLALLLVPAGHSAHHQRGQPAAGWMAVRKPQLLPPRVVRTAAVAQQHRQVKVVR